MEHKQATDQGNIIGDQKNLTATTTWSSIKTAKTQIGEKPVLLTSGTGETG